MVPHVRSFDEIKDLCRDKAYYEPRSYLGVAGTVVNGLLMKYQIESVLELGPHEVPLVEGSDIMDIRAAIKNHLGPGGHLDSGCLCHTWDARQTPWPIRTRAYDLFIGLQVFEHLWSNQCAAFREVRRVAKHAIISLPIDWEQGDWMHQGITDEKARRWFSPVVPSWTLIGTDAPHKRVIYVFENLEPIADSKGGKEKQFKLDE